MTQLLSKLNLGLKMHKKENAMRPLLKEEEARQVLNLFLGRKTDMEFVIGNAVIIHEEYKRRRLVYQLIVILADMPKPSRYTFFVFSDNGDLLDHNCLVSTRPTMYRSDGEAYPL